MSNTFPGVPAYWPGHPTAGTHIWGGMVCVGGSLGAIQLSALWWCALGTSFSSSSAPVTQYKNPLPPGGCRAKSPEPSTRLGLSPAAQLSLSTVSPLAPRNSTPSPPHWVSVPSDSELGEQLRREPIQRLCASQAPTAPPHTPLRRVAPLPAHTTGKSPSGSNHVHERVCMWHVCACVACVCVCLPGNRSTCTCASLQGGASPLLLEY